MGNAPGRTGRPDQTCQSEKVTTGSATEGVSLDGAEPKFVLCFFEHGVVVGLPVLLNHIVDLAEVLNRFGCTEIDYRLGRHINGLVCPFSPEHADAWLAELEAGAATCSDDDSGSVSAHGGSDGEEPITLSGDLAGLLEPGCPVVDVVEQHWTFDRHAERNQVKVQNERASAFMSRTLVGLNLSHPDGYARAYGWLLSICDSYTYKTQHGKEYAEVHMGSGRSFVLRPDQNPGRSDVLWLGDVCRMAANRNNKSAEVPNG